MAGAAQRSRGRNERSGAREGSSHFIGGGAAEVAEHAVADTNDGGPLLGSSRFERNVAFGVEPEGAVVQIGRANPQ